MHKIARIVVAVGALAALAVPASANLITNAGFETAGLVGWSPSGAASDSTGDPLTGTHNAVLSGTSTLSQTFVTTPGAEYLVSFHYRNFSPDITVPIMNEFDVLFDGSILAFNFNLPQPGYGLIQGPATASTGLTTLRFGTGNFIPNSGTWHLDDVSVEFVPEPATVGLLGMGLLSVAGFLRRKRQ